MRFIYTLLLYIVLPLIVLRLLWRSIKAPLYRRRCLERFGFLSAENKRALNPQHFTLWFHSVSVGETIASRPFVESIINDNPNCQLVITTMTPTGSAQVESLFSDQIQQQKVIHNYIPYDLPDSICRFLGAVKPDLVVFMETEVWPNTIHACREKNIPTLLINARLSERSLLGYQRFSALSKPMFSGLTAIAAQTKEDAARLAMLGAMDITITGSLKSDIAIDSQLEQKAKVLREDWSKAETRKVILAASTHRSEDEFILQAYALLKENHPDILLVIVPRHPERFDEVERLCLKQHYQCQRKSLSLDISLKTDIVIGDTMGELFMFCGACDVVIMGGTFVDNGGHNFLEPAAWGVPILSGHSAYNFAEIAQQLVKTNALVQVDSSEQLAEQLAAIVTDDNLAQQRGDAAKHYIENNKGSLTKVLGVVQAHIKNE